MITKKTKLKVILGFFIAVATALIIGLGYALKPFLIAFVFAYLLYPLILRLEKKGISRIVSVSVIIVILGALTVYAVMAFMPPAINETAGFLKELPSNSVKAVQKLETLAQKNGIDLQLTEYGIHEIVKTQASMLSAGAIAKASGAVTGIFAGLLKTLLAILNVLLIPLFFFFMIIDYELIRDEVKNYIPARYMEIAGRYMAKVNKILDGYIKGKLVVAVILGLMYGLGLHIIGLKFGFVIGFASGILSIVPYVGSFIGFAAAFVMGLAYYQGPWMFVWICVVFTVAQVLESYWLTPHLVGNSVGLSAFVSILAIIIGGNLMGVLGIFIAIPLAAILREALIDLRHEYHELMKEVKVGKGKK